VESTLNAAAKTFENVRVSEFTVAPQVSPPQGELPFHELFIEFEKAPSDINAFAKIMDEALQNQNSY